MRVYTGTTTSPLLLPSQANCQLDRQTTMSAGFINPSDKLLMNHPERHRSCYSAASGFTKVFRLATGAYTDALLGSRIDLAHE